MGKSSRVGTLRKVTEIDGSLLRELAEALKAAKTYLHLGRKYPEPDATEYLDEAMTQVIRAEKAFNSLWGSRAREDLQLE